MMNASGTGSCLKKADWFSIVGVTVRREGAGLQPVQSAQSRPQTCALHPAATEGAAAEAPAPLSGSEPHPVGDRPFQAI
jgi:hypothetical protein